jgi:NAD-dependent dihydropyrimidine dehydrogenase PreA subunit
MSLRALLVELWGLLTRFFPWPAATGLEAIGAPGPEAPVLLSGNYRVAVQRLRRAMRGEDAWLLVANSRGINVWCAAAGGHLTNHEVITALRSSGVEQRVTHRELILPQLCATGVEPRTIEERTGWRARFGPVRVDDLPAFLQRGKTTRTMRTVRFGLPERLEMGVMWGLPVSALCLLGGGLVSGLHAGSICAAAALLTALFLYLALPALPARGRERFSTGLGAAAVFFALAGGAWVLTAGSSLGAAAAFGALGLVLGAIFVIDLAGSTPTLGSDSHHTERFRVEVLPDPCTGCAECVLVCPREVLAIHDELAALTRPAGCIRCGACLVQCPEDALRFRYDDGAVIEAAVVRRTKLNLLGKRAVRVRSEDPS